MKSLVILGIFLASSFAVAQGGGFEEQKSHVLQNVDERISMLQDMKSCVVGAGDLAALKVCQEKRKDYNRNKKAAKRQHRKDRMDKRIERMKAKRAKMDEKGS